jgi:glucose/arabinose dehydrogenase
MKRFLVLLCALSISATACAAEKKDGYPSQAGVVQLTTVASGLEQPWALAFLPDGRMLVTEKPGRLRIVDKDGKVSPPLGNVPKVDARGQGGLLDVVLAPDFSTSRRIYLSYSEPRGEANGTAVAHAQLGDTALSRFTVIFRQRPDKDSRQHFGSRLVFDRDGQLYVTLGDRGKSRDEAQKLDGHLGKVVRLTADGRPAPGNPFLQRKDAMPEIWSYGHRNPQGAALHPRTGKLWLHEHGPQGGDEINVSEPGRNYGWPLITYGREYSGLKVGDGATAKDGLEQPLHYWVPSIAPSGMAFYTADRFPQWKGNLFVGSLKFGQLVRLVLDGERVTGEERLLEGHGRRIRDVRAGPDGYLYLLTDESQGKILRLGLAS